MDILKVIEHNARQFWVQSKKKLTAECKNKLVFPSSYYYQRHSRKCEKFINTSSHTVITPEHKRLYLETQEWFSFQKKQAVNTTLTHY